MKSYKISSKLLFVLLICISDLEKNGLVNYKELNKKIQIKLENINLKNIKLINQKNISTSLNCVGNAIFKNEQDTYYTKIQHIYSYFYAWQSTLQYKTDNQDLWQLLSANLKNNNHFTEKEIKRFSDFNNMGKFKINTYKTYKKMNWLLFNKDNQNEI